MQLEKLKDQEIDVMSSMWGLFLSIRVAFSIAVPR